MRAVGADQDQVGQVAGREIAQIWQMNAQMDRNRLEIDRLKAETDAIKEDTEMIKARLQSRLDSLLARL